jgi:hypothetical protein
MAKILANAVHLTDESGVVHSFLPGQTPPKWARKLITNPKAWVAEEPSDSDDESAEEPENSEQAAESQDDSSDDSTEDSSETSTETPDIPKKNASTAVWRAYADKNGFETDDDIKRDEIIAALAGAGIPTE